MTPEFAANDHPEFMGIAHQMLPTPPGVFTSQSKVGHDRQRTGTLERPEDCTVCIEEGLRWPEANDCLVTVSRIRLDVERPAMANTVSSRADRET